MYLEIFLADFAFFLGISRDFTEIPEFRGSATKRNIRSPVKSIHCTLEVVTKHKITCLDKTDVVIAEIKSATKRFLKIHFKFTYYTFFLGTETVNTLIHNHVPL